MPGAARKVLISDRTLKALKPAEPGKRITVWDAIQPNLCVRVSDKGRVSFTVVRRPTGSRKVVWTVLGRYPAMTLAKAREAARDALQALEAGKHPREVKETQRKAEEAQRRASIENTFSALAERFIAEHLPNLRSRKAVETLIRRELIPALGDTPIGEINRGDILELVEDIAARGKKAPGHRRMRNGGKHTARHTLLVLHKMFNWALARDKEGKLTNPCARVKANDLYGKPKKRDRVLSNNELRWVWQAAEAMKPSPFGVLYQVLMLTGQRLREISEATWTEFDFEAATLTISAERMKSGLAHTVPLTPVVLQLLSEMPQFARSDFVFSTDLGRKRADNAKVDYRPISGFSKTQARMVQAVATLAAPVPVPHWQIHDLRRTARTGMSACGVSPFIAGLVIGHRQEGVQEVYDLHTYDSEKRAALLKWEAKLLSIIAPGPEPENVIALPAMRVSA